MIRITGLSKSFEDIEVLKEVNIHVPKGKIYGLVGSNGCGKTTVFKHILGLYKEDNGDITYDDQSIQDRNYLSRVYYVQDDLYFPLNYTLDDLFHYEALNYSTLSQEKFLHLKEFFKMDGTRKLRTMSKGQKKQAAFIVAIASMAETLVLDEIVDGLDAVIRKMFWKVLMTEVMDRSLTVLISSHALTELDNICDTVGILHEGKIVKESSIDQLKEETRRVQFAIEDTLALEPTEAYEVVKTSLIGRVYFVVIKGDVEQFSKDLHDKHNVLLYEELNMNLEEIFVTELGGLGYGSDEYFG